MPRSGSRTATRTSTSRARREGRRRECEPLSGWQDCHPCRYTSYGYSGEVVSEVLVYRVPAMHCDHCEAAIKQELVAVEGVEVVDVDLDAKLVTVRGERLEDGRLRAAIDDAGYDVV